VLPWLAAPKSAAACLNPGIGGAWLSIIIGGVPGLGVVAKLYWHWLKSLFGSSGKQAQEERPGD